MIVADTGPLNYLIQIADTHLLPVLFTRVYLPFEVAQELQQERTPQVVRQWMQSPPSWLTIVEPSPRAVLAAGLHSGEAAAIELAETLGGQMLLMDDFRGRQHAALRGLPVIGTVGALFEAASRNLIDFEVHLSVLRETNFYLSRELHARYLQRWKSTKNRPA